MAKGPTLNELGMVVDTDPGPESVHEALRASLAEVNGTEAGTSEHAGSGAVPLEQGAPAGSVKVQNRDPTGKFASGFTQAELDAQAAAEREGDGGSVGKPATETTTEPQPLEPPPNWKLEAQEEFRKLAPAQQKFVLDRLDEIPKPPDIWKELEPVVTSRQPIWSRNGVKPAQALQQLLDLNDYAAQHPEEFARWFISSRKLDPAKLLGSAAPADKGPASALDQIDPEDPVNKDPVFLALKKEILALNSRLGEVTGHLESRTQQERTTVQASADNEINSFKEAKNPDGTLKHPHFEEVRTLMGVMFDPRVSDQTAPDLETAYMMACRAHPQVHAKVVAAENARAAREREKADREKAARASRAGASVTGTPGSNTTVPQSTGDLRSDLTAEFKARGMFGNVTI